MTAQGVRAGQRVVFVDEMRVGLIGQVRRRWTVRGVRLCPRVERSSKWRYLQVAVDPLSGEVWQRWSARLGKEAAVAALSEWRALGVAVVVWDNAGSHRARAVREVGVVLVYLPACWSDTNRAFKVHELSPLLQVPLAKRGEPRTGSVPPACRGNLKEGVFNRACFCKLCPRDWYNILLPFRALQSRAEGLHPQPIFTA